MLRNALQNSTTPPHADFSFFWSLVKKLRAIDSFSDNQGASQENETRSNDNSRSYI